MKIEVEFDDKGLKYLQLYTELKRMITKGELKYKDRLPTIRQLSNDLNINTVTVSKAYNLLESDGYISKKIGSGTYISIDINSHQKIDGNSKNKYYRLDNANPSLEMFPIEDFKKAINMAMEKEGAGIFAYDEEHGINELKEELNKYLYKYGIDTSTKNIIIISGGQQGIDITTKAIVNYSDVVFVEEPTYPGAINIFKSRGAKVVSIPMLDDGIDIGILKLKLEKIRPRLLYVMPNYQNPTGITYSIYKKKKILELAEEYDFYIIEDDFISDLKFGKEQNKTLKSLDKNNRVIYIKSFSKILMPGLRVGMICVPNELIQTITISKDNSDIATSTLIQKSLYYYMKEFDWFRHIDYIEKIYTNRYEESKRYIKKHLGDKLDIIENNGGINFFLGLKRGYYSKDFCEYMKKKKILLLPGVLFYDDKIQDRHFRLNIATESIDRIREAIDIIEENIDDFYKEYEVK